MSDFFRLKKTCKDCPFSKKSLQGWLGEQRARQITNDLRAKSFSCHKTVNYSSSKKRENEAFCAGAILVQENMYKQGKTKIGDSLQLGERLGLYKRSEMRDHNTVFNDFDEFINHHKG